MIQNNTTATGAKARQQLLNLNNTLVANGYEAGAVDEALSHVTSESSPELIATELRHHGVMTNETLASVAVFVALTMRDTIIQIDVATIAKVYSGKNGRCCCGCSGKYSYASAHREQGSKDRGYTVDDEDINDRTVKAIVGKINTAVEREDGDGYFATVISGRLYVAYPVKISALTESENGKTPTVQ